MTSPAKVSPAKVSAAVVGVFVVALGALLLLTGREAGDPGGSSVATETGLVRSDSRVLGEPGSTDVVLVEFLDFECEACGAAFPVVEQLRQKYAGQVTFVARYFPLPGHFNAERAARSVEAAARQGKFEDMYTLMFATQHQWGEQQVPIDETFRQYAEQIGLDLEQYDADYADPAVAERVQRDVADGVELGVQGTPTFFLNGARFEPRSFDDFDAALAEALAQQR